MPFLYRVVWLELAGINEYTFVTIHISRQIQRYASGLALIEESWHSAQEKKVNGPESAKYVFPVEGVYSFWYHINAMLAKRIASLL